MGWTEEGRVAARIRERVSRVVLFELQDPRIEPARLTVTRVRLARDFSVCDVYYSVLGGEAERNKVAHALEDASGHIRREVGKILRTRTVPRLRFEFDRAVEGGLRVSGLLDRLKREREEAEGEKGDPPASDSRHRGEEPPGGEV